MTGNKHSGTFSRDTNLTNGVILSGMSYNFNSSSSFFVVSFDYNLVRSLSSKQAYNYDNPLVLDVNTITNGQSTVAFEKKIGEYSSSGSGIDDNLSGIESTDTLQPGNYSITVSAGNGRFQINGQSIPYLKEAIKVAWSVESEDSPVESSFVNTGLMHKLLYASQNLNTSVTASNKSSSTVSGKENFYLSTNSDPSVSSNDIALNTSGNTSLTLKAGETKPLSSGSEPVAVNIPASIQPGTYYVKAVFITSSGEMGSVAVSPALTTSLRANKTVSSFATSNYPKNVTIYEAAVDDVKQGKAIYKDMMTEDDIKSFIQNNEDSQAKKLYYCYSDNDVPAVGFGSDLTDKETGEVVPEFKSIIETYINAHPGIGFTFDDFLKIDTSAYVDKATALKLFQVKYMKARDYVDSNYNSVSMNQRAALIDICYNVGEAGIKKFKDMNSNLAIGTPASFAAAGLEFINSKRTVDLGPKQGLVRTRQDFFLLTSVAGVADYL